MYKRVVAIVHLVNVILVGKTALVVSHMAAVLDLRIYGLFSARE